MIYIERVNKLILGMSIYDNYVVILIYAILLSFNEFIIQFRITLNIILYKLIYNLFIYRVYNQVSKMNISENYVRIFHYSSYFIP